MNSTIKFPRVTEKLGKRLSIEDFTYIRSLGKGSFGQVGLYLHNNTAQQYAIKKICLTQQQKKGFSRQELEAVTRKQLEILYKINNDHIMKIIDHFEQKNYVYLVTQLISGNNLYDQTLKDKKQINIETAAQIIYQTCLGLEQLHENHIIHRDIKLENLMFDGKKVKIVDLGCSNYYAESIERLTQIGTKPYWAPQIIMRDQQNDRLDIWCVGVVLYELLFMESPFSYNDHEKKIRKCEYHLPSSASKDSDLEDLFQKVFSYKNDRISASELKGHPWISKNRRKTDEKILKTQKFLTESQVKDYHNLLDEGIKSQQQYLRQINDRSSRLDELLKQARKELKTKNK